MEKYGKALETYDRLFSMAPAMKEIETRLRLIEQVLVRNIALSGADEESREHADACQLVSVLAESANALYSFYNLFTEVAEEAAEILGQDAPEEEDTVH